MQISIMGCGWLGQPLARQLLRDGHNIVATCRADAKQKQLQQLGFSTQLYNLGDSVNTDAIKSVLQCDLLILNIPPGGKQIQPTFFTKQMCDLVKQAKMVGTKRLLFISTTAVYGEAQGEMHEQSPCTPTTQSAQAHLKIEQQVLASFAHDACILRLAGLVGHDRHPAKHLAAKTNLNNALQPVNLIHQQDVIAAIKLIIEFEHFGHIFHLSAHEHPSREDYYQWACNKLGLLPPTFIDSEEDSPGKKINAKWTCDTLRLDLSYPSPYDMLT
jgi:nucleoside-diphosphate-sugar epimerase